MTLEPPFSHGKETVCRTCLSVEIKRLGEHKYWFPSHLGHACCKYPCLMVTAPGKIIICLTISFVARVVLAFFKNPKLLRTITHVLYRTLFASYNRKEAWWVVLPQFKFFLPNLGLDSWFGQQEQSTSCWQCKPMGPLFIPVSRACIHSNRRSRAADKNQHTLPPLHTPYKPSRVSW